MKATEAEEILEIGSDQELMELAALELVGQETVRYVSNINKYYVIYRNALERGEICDAKKEVTKGGI